MNLKQRIRLALERLSSAGARARSALDLQDAFVFGGLACVAYGLHQIYPPAAWIVVGGALFWLGARSN